VIDALSPLYPRLAKGYPASERSAASKIAYVLFLFSLPVLLLSIAGLWSDTPLLAVGSATLMLIVMVRAHRLTREPQPRSAGLLAVVALGSVAATIVALLEDVDPTVTGRSDLVIAVVIGLSAVLLTGRQPLVMTMGWSVIPIAAVCLPLIAAEVSAMTVLVEALKSFFAFVAGAALMRIIHRTLQDRQDRYAGLLELSAIGIMELDLTRAAALFMGLAIGGVTDIDKWLAEDAERTYQLVDYCSVTNLNETMATMLGVDHSADAVRKRTALTSSRSVAESIQAHILAMWHGAETAATQAVVTNRLGEARALILHTARRRTEKGFDNAHVVLTAVDVEDRREAEEELQRQVSRREQLIASVSHELRTPMASVIGFADELLDRPGDFDVAEQRELLEMIRSQSVDVANILDDLLVKARADFDDVSVMCAVVDLTAVVKPLLEELGMQDVGYELNEIAVWADRIRVRQILRNLLTNARRYGGPETRIVAEKRGSMAHIAVRDNGEALDLETSRTIFEAFERAHNVIGVTSSVGLGLTISRQLARAMNGEIWYAHDGREAAFSLALPLTRPVEPGPELAEHMSTP
jgi:signal transduction histidine kinase